VSLKAFSFLIKFNERLNLYERYVTMYLYGSLKIDDYMKLHEGANFHETSKK